MADRTFTPEEQAVIQRALDQRDYSREETALTEEAFNAPEEGETDAVTGHRWAARWAVSIDGTDMTDRMNPYLQSIEVQDKDGTATDTCSLVLDDSKAQIKMPSPGGSVKVSLNDVDVFEGTIDEIRSTGARGQGRILTISAKGFDANVDHKVKSQLDFHKDDATLQAFMDDAATRAGLQGITIDPAFASIVRDYWAADRESFLHLGERIARDYGGTFKIRGDRAVLAQRNTGVTPSGQPLPSLTAEWGKNLLRWDIAPYVGRPRSKKARVKYYDKKKAKFEEKVVEIDYDGDGDIDADDQQVATSLANYSANDADAATKSGTGKKTKSQRESGEGTVVVPLLPEARVEGTLTVKGARPGVDGPYRISSVTHKLDRSGGSTTTLELKQPGTGTGKGGDARKASGEFDVEAYIAEQARVTTSGAGVDNT